MTLFRVLDASRPEGEQTWLALWNESPYQEVMALPAYVKLFARPVDEVLCAVSESSDGTILFPFILRRLAVEEWASDRTGLCDLTGPYGYGGPFVWGTPKSTRFWQEFEDWAHSREVVCCFVRLSLFPEQLIPMIGSVELANTNIVRSLTMAAPSIWRDYDAKVRKNVQKALRSDVEVEIDVVGTKLDEFISLYYSTMDRRDASGFYYFPRSFFERLVADLKGRFAFFHAIHRGTMISTELVLESAHSLYSFLGGSLAEWYHLRPNDLLKHMIIKWGVQRGKHAFVLGGGYAPGDGICRYKRSFAPKGERGFYVAKIVFDPVAYQLLLGDRRRWEASQGNQWEPDGSFFPLYRGRVK